MPNATFVRPELAKLLPIYEMIRDVISGETAVKGARTKYLPMPNANDTSPENKARYDAYLARAVFYNVARRTLSGLVGQVFTKEAVVKVPSSLDGVVKNATGAGISIEQLAKKAVQLTLAYSRCGLLVDYPTTEDMGGVTIADLEKGNIRPTLYVYAPQEIINWRTVDIGAEEVLSLVVLSENYSFDDDGFELKNATQLRVLKLNEAGQYVHEIWREKVPTKSDGRRMPKGTFKQHEMFMPKDSSGAPLTRIPFAFIGSENNDHNPDSPNFYDLASLNIAHYRNSADYEESCYIVGQPTPVLTGLTEEWVNDVLKGTVSFGSRGGIPLPVGANATMLQASPNTMIKEAMDTKERQMVALGARLVEQKTVQRTATEANIDASSESSTLANVANNVSAAFTWALAWAAWWIGQQGSDVVFSLNTEFDMSKVSPAERQQIIKEWQTGAITYDEMRKGLRKAGVATEDDEIARAKIAAELADNVQGA